MRFSISLLVFFFYTLVVGQDYIFQNVNVLPMTDNVVLEGMDVVVRDGKIDQIVEKGLIDNISGLLTIDGTGKYLMPGLSEMHAHIPVPRNGENEDYVKETMLLYLANGVTVIRGMLGNPYHLKLKKKVLSGEILAPRIYTSSPSMNGNSIPTIEEARAKVKDANQKGYDFLKIHPGIKLEVMKELVATANEVGIRFAGHVPVEVGIDNALEFGYWSVDHIDGYVRGVVANTKTYEEDEIGFFGSGLVNWADSKKIKPLAQKTKAQNVWVVPTQSLFVRWISPTPAVEMMQEPEMKYIPGSMRYAWRSGKEQLLAQMGSSDIYNYKKFNDLRRSILKAMHDEGVGFLLGSDSPQVMNVPGFSIHHEIESLVEADIPIYDIIKSGTANPAKFFEAEGSYGTIVKGAEADIVLVDGNPLENPKVLKRPLGVMIQGQWLTKSFFDEQLESIAKNNEGDSE